MAFFPIITRCMTKFPVTETIINPWFRPFAGTLQMKLPYQSTGISSIRNQLGNNRRPVGKRIIAIASVMNSARIKPTHETRSAWSTDRALTIRMGEGDPFVYQVIHYWSTNMRIPQRSNGVKSLLVRAVPENIRLLAHCVWLPVALSLL